MNKRNQMIDELKAKKDHKKQITVTIAEKTYRDISAYAQKHTIPYSKIVDYLLTKNLNLLD